MARQIFIGLWAEGTTDQRFLKSIIERTFNEIKFESDLDIDIFEVEAISVQNAPFIEQVLEAASYGLHHFGMNALCVHTDANNKSNTSTYEYKIIPARHYLESKHRDKYCKNLVALVPIQEIEAWMLADKELLKREIGTKKTDSELGIDKVPESIASPKEVIEKAIHVARAEFTKRRRSHLTIADLYLPIGQSIDLKKLSQLDSYQDFKENVREAFRKLNLLH
jgi:hypothetical protein